MAYLSILRGSDDMAKGCNNCPARSKCEGLTYRGSDCAALRHRYGAPEDPDIRSGADDLISRKTLIEALDNDGVIDGFTYSDGETLLQKIQSIPVADAVEVIRCGQCCYSAHEGELWICVHPYHYCDCGAKIVKPNYFCSFGDRKCSTRFLAQRGGGTT